MDPTDNLEEASAAPTAFEKDLKALVLEAFADEAAIEGTWEITLPINDAPNWVVEIAKVQTDETSYDPEGDSSEPTWLSWTRSDAFRDAFPNREYGDGEPDPSLVATEKIGQLVSTYRYTWGDGPSDSNVLGALD
jgi:hypothetical protein